MGQAARENQIQAGFKFQFRQLETLIHPDYIARKDVKHIPRFVETRIPKSSYETLVAEARKEGMLTIVTPFDEESIGWATDMQIDILKVASCSAADKPLLQAMAQSNKPIIVSTGGLTLSQIDWVVSFLAARQARFALMHCVSLYPTLPDKLNLNQIDLLKARYPEIPIGWSTHEEPDNLTAVQIAKAKGAQLFERHVGIANKKYKLNAYSSTPAQVDAWIKAYKNAVDSCGGEERSPAPREEIESLRTLYRGVWLKRDIKKGEGIDRSDVFFAMPLQDGQMVSGDWDDNLVADQDYEAKTALAETVVRADQSAEQMVFGIMLQVKGMLSKARIFVNDDASIEISHHYGLERFREFGCVIVNCINREYAKKLLIQLPRQKHPYHFHEKKEETFQLLWGDLEVEVEGKKHRLLPGDTLLVERAKWHKFHTLDGCVFEEVSTTHLNSDSFYEDPKIQKLSRQERKTNVDSWARAFMWK